jgi:hypothetical protein
MRLCFLIFNASLNSLLRVVSMLCVVLLIAGFLSQVCFTQNVAKVTDFTGCWSSETVNVSTNSGRPFPGSSSSVEIELIVKQTGNELYVKETSRGTRGDFTRESVYYLDGRGEANNGRTAELVYDSKTEIVDGKLLIRSIIRPRNSPTGSITHTEQWEIASDRKKLRKTTTSGMGGVRNEMVFRLEP